MRMRTQWLGVEPLGLFLAVVKNLFTAEKHRCHFESTLEHEAFGEFRYFNKIYYEVSLRSSLVFNEEAFRESLLNFGSLQERVLFLPLNLVFLLTTPEQKEAPTRALQQM